MANFEFDSNGIDNLINDLESAPYDCECSVCGMKFEASQEELLQPTVTCPHCGAELEEV